MLNNLFCALNLPREKVLSEFLCTKSIKKCFIIIHKFDPEMVFFKGGIGKGSEKGQIFRLRRAKRQYKKWIYWFLECAPLWGRKLWVWESQTYDCGACEKAPQAPAGGEKFGGKKKCTNFKTLKKTLIGWSVFYQHSLWSTGIPYNSSQTAADYTHYF